MEILILVNLLSSQRQYLLVGQCLMPFAINFVLNGLIGLAMFRGVDPVPTWGIESSAGPDLIGTCFFLPAITCLIVTPIVRRHIRAGMIEPASASGFLPSWLRPFQRPLAARAVLFGVAGLALIGSLVAAVLLSAAPAQFGLTPFLWLKASFSAVLGGAVTPIIGLVALAESEPQMQAP
jgi:hypothetical protein